jgi:hypothetical protein
VLFIPFIVVRAFRLSFSETMDSGSGMIQHVKRWHQRLLLIWVMSGLFWGSIAPVRAQSGGGTSLFLPAVMNGSAGISGARTVNIPYLNKASIGQSDFTNTAIVWYGQVNTDSNYSDVRLAYNDSELFIYIATFDRRLWYNPSSNGSGLEDWDAVTLRLYTGAGGGLDQNAYRFTAQLYESWQSPAKFQASARGNGSAWASASLPFTTTPAWRGDGINTNVDDRGWGMIFRIPFSSLGLNSRPADGTEWRLGLQTHDRDAAAAASAAAAWPENLGADQPNSWGVLRFGLPAVSAAAAVNVQTVAIRRGLNAAQTPDADVGGGSNCGMESEPEFFPSWGALNHAGHGDFNIQNQADIADWPCYARYYVQFPLDAIPAGKVIQSAELILHQFGGSDPAQAVRSNIQVFAVAESWDEAALNWNNAPLAYENLGATTVDVLAAFPGWPGVAYAWNVTRAVRQSYADGGGWVRLALYSADSAYHSGKYFVSADAEDWNAAARPTLRITFGDAP